MAMTVNANSPHIMSRATTPFQVSHSTTYLIISLIATLLIVVNCFCDNGLVIITMRVAIVL